MSDMDTTKKKMDGALEFLKTELKGIRTGRANPGMVETVSVEVYGAQMRLQDIASISVPEPRQLLISPFDVNNTHAIAKGIEAANLNLRPLVDGNVVRINIPEMDQSVRAEMVRQAKEKCEKTKVAIRQLRREANDHLKKSKSDGDIGEDQQKSGEKKVQELTDKYCKLADDATAQKEKEITTI